VSRIAIDRVTFVIDVEKPLNERGGSPGLDKVFERHPKMGRHPTEIWLDDTTVPSVIVLRDPVSGEEECVPLSNVKGYRTSASRDAAAAYRTNGKPVKSTKAA
jgi:hypothetical protein